MENGNSQEPGVTGLRDAEPATDLMKEFDVNLSDFPLFLMVMKDKRAYGNALSIILDEEDIQLREVKVEEVVLNKTGKRAIRLDAWALSEDDRQFDMEMQNESDQDSLPKRSRFYQGMIDSPILKSGQKTKYRQLPSTTIIFITQDDIFEKNLAKYTFTEQCEEVAGLKLGDGTTKIFLNMTSRNGSPELISLLQYMKHTSIDNPNIISKDRRLIELDQVVCEVRNSEEWEAIRVDLIDYGIKQGIQRGRKQGLDEGELKNLIRQVSKKRIKKCSVAEAADMLEADVCLVQKVYDALETLDAETQWERIIQQVKGN